MLKLERKNQEVSVSLRGPLRSFDRTFCIAFSIAALLHLAGLILFHVQPFKLKSVETIFPPVAVNIDFRPISDHSILTNLEEKRLHHPRVEKPTLSTPKFSKVQHTDNSKSFIYNRVKSAKLDPFKEYETQMEQAALAKLDGSSIHREAFIISGPIGDKEWKSEHPLPQVEMQLVYQVKLNDQEGKIISIEQIEGIQSLEIEKYLSTIQFEKDSNGLITSGMIEIFPGGQK